MKTSVTHRPSWYFTNASCHCYLEKKKAFSDNELFVKFTLHHCSINGSKHNLALSDYNFPFLSSFYLPAIVNRDRIETQDQYKAWFFENQHLESC